MHQVVTATHHYYYPAESVFGAFLDKQKASKFMFATPEGEMVKVEIDAKVGGHYEFVDRRDGVDVLHTGEYLELHSPNKLSFTFMVPQYSKESTTVEISIVERKNACELTLKHSGVLSEYAERTKEGWKKILSNLEATLK